MQSTAQDKNIFVIRWRSIEAQCENAIKMAQIQCTK